MRIAAICIAGLFIGSASASDLPRIFMTSVTGNGNLSTWPDAHGLSGLAAADEICRSRAAAASIAESEDYVAYLSDGSDDAYCRLHGAHGRRSEQCGQGTLPTGAGPWYRIDDLAAIDVAENSLIPATSGVGGYVPRAIVSDEFGNLFAPSESEGAQDFAFTGSGLDGSLADAASTCSDWTSSDAGITVLLATSYRGYGGLASAAWTCDQSLRLVCLEKGAHGPPLSKRRPPTARMAFVTSSTGPGDFSTWPDGVGATSVDAADNVCRAHAARASLPQSRTYKAWLSTSKQGAIDRFVFDGPWYRVDGARVAQSLVDLADGVIDAPMQLDENAEPLAGGQAAWSGTFSDGSATSFTCADWTASNNSNFGLLGSTFASDTNWSYISSLPFPFSCEQAFHVYCLSDSDSIFEEGFDP